MSDLEQWRLDMMITPAQHRRLQGMQIWLKEAPPGEIVEAVIAALDGIATARARDYLAPFVTAPKEAGAELDGEWPPWLSCPCCDGDVLQSRGKLCGGCFGVGCSGAPCVQSSDSVGYEMEWAWQEGDRATCKTCGCICEVDLGDEAAYARCIEWCVRHSSECNVKEDPADTLAI